jgi:hypothetical protein
MMRRILSLLPLFLLIAGCAGAPVETSGLRFYPVNDFEGVGLIRAFSDHSTTVLHFAAFGSVPLVLTDQNGRKLEYRQVGDHYVVLPGIHRELTVRAAGREVTVRISDFSSEDSEPAPSKTVPRIMEREALPAPPPAPVESIPEAPVPAPIPLPRDARVSGLTGYVVEVLSCHDRRKAEKVKGALIKRGYDAEIKVETHPKHGQVFLVRLKPVGVVEAYSSMDRIQRKLRLRPALLEIPPEELSAYQKEARL